MNAGSTPTQNNARRNHLTHQHCARRPFAAKTKTHQCAEEQKLVIDLRKPAEQREQRKPENSDLQRTNPSELVGEGARDPPA